MSDIDRAISFGELSTSDLNLETVYLGGNYGNVKDDPIDPLVPGVGNQGGIRYAGSPWQRAVRVCVLYTTGTVPDWPDSLDPQTGLFTYYGDNKQPGRELHETTRGGNLLLRDAFDAAHGPSREDRLRVPPFLLFEKASPGRAVRFRGLLAPGSPRLNPDEELVAIWRSRNGLRFQNYRAVFTVLDVNTVSRSWLSAIGSGEPSTNDDCPEAWREWVEGRAYQALVAKAATVIPTPAQQQPSDSVGRAMLQVIQRHFEDRPTDFEECAVEIWRMIAPGTGDCDVTRPSRDGGRDAVGLYPLGPTRDQIYVEFALEAKCYAPTTTVGVKEISRLISRIRPRNFGVFLTLSHFGTQAYEEVRSDQHPIALVCGRDVVDILREKGYGDVSLVQAWLDSRFPAPSD